MKKKHQWKENLAEALELRYETQELVILTFSGKLIIHGKSLRILCYTPEEMQIQGSLSEIILEQ